jgi:hypothetical protein
MQQLNGYLSSGGVELTDEEVQVLQELQKAQGPAEE